MLPAKRLALTKGQRRLLEAYAALGKAERETLLAFAEFLAARPARPEEAQVTVPPEPKAIPRPAEESVVGAMRRLSASYFMLDRDVLLQEASSLMAAHVMHGKPAKAVIDQLEELFRRAYDQLRQERRG